MGSLRPLRGRAQLRRRLDLTLRAFIMHVAAATTTADTTADTDGAVMGGDGGEGVGAGAGAGSGSGMGLPPLPGPSSGYGLHEGSSLWEASTTIHALNATEGLATDPNHDHDHDHDHEGAVEPSVEPEGVSVVGPSEGVVEYMVSVRRVLEGYLTMDTRVSPNPNPNPNPNPR